MIKIRKTNGHVQSVISLQTQPHHQTIDSIIGSAMSNKAGTVIYGFNSMEYTLPGGDRLRLIANHSKHHVQILLLSSDPAKLQNMPGARPASLVADTIARINRYLLRSDSYQQPRTKAQEDKYSKAQNCIAKLTDLLAVERSIKPQNWIDQESLRANVIALIDKCWNQNILLANQLLVSEGQFGIIIYEARQAAQQYEFNRLYPVTRLDQADFTQHTSLKKNATSCFVWDSELHIGYDEPLINDALRCICNNYQLQPAIDLNNVPANRFKRVEVFFRKLFASGIEWVDYLSLPEKPVHQIKTTENGDGFFITHIEPYYHFEGLKQNRFPTLQALVNQYLNGTSTEIQALTDKEAETLLCAAPNDCWYHAQDQQLIIIRHQNQIIKLRYFFENNQYCPLPNGQDLYRLSQLSRQHLYFFERFGLKLKAFFSHIPVFWNYFTSSLLQFAHHDIRDEFINHVEANHQRKIPDIELMPPTHYNSNIKLVEELHSKKLLANGQSLHDFIQQQLTNCHYVIAREEHPPSPIAYSNPLHRTLGILRHFSGFFIDTSEKNPLIGSLAMAAYIYGGAAVIAPQALTSLLTKLHLHGLIKGIAPTQALGRWMSHGTTSEAVSAAITYWQGIIVGGDLDQFFIQAIHVLHEDPAEVAIIVSLAMAMGYGLCEAIPPLAREMGQAPYFNYAALGAKTGAAIYDTVMNPGEDWLLGTIKWFLRGGVIGTKLLIAPLIEWSRYGFKEGFVSGLKKSALLLLGTLKEVSAALIDMSLILLSVPFLEISALFIHVPFRGISGLLSKTLGAFSNAGSVGELLVDVANQIGTWNFMSGFRFSPLYGFGWLHGEYSKNAVVNGILNTLAILLTPVWQVFKNVLLLPLLDALFLSARLCLSMFIPVVHLLVYGIGKSLLTISPLWDNSVGIFLGKAATGISVTANSLDDYASQCKRVIVSGINVGRRAVFHWAFGEKDQHSHYKNADFDYFKEKPIRLERINPSSHFLMTAFFAARKTIETKAKATMTPPLQTPSLYKKEGISSERFQRSEGLMP